MKNSNLKPQLRKKNGVWIKVLVPVLCVVAGAGAMAGLIAGVPAVSNAVIKHDTNTVNPGTSSSVADQEKLTELQNKLNTANAQLAVRNEQIANKDLQVSNLSTQVETLKNQLQAFSDYEEIKSQLELKSAELEQAKADDASDTEAISELQQQVIDLTAKKQELENECEGYRELLGSDVTYAEMVVQLQNELSTANSQLETITAERDSLLAEKETLTQQVADLTIQVNSLQAQLNNYVGTENVDKLKVESYNGTWYLNSTYEDYFIITDGVVVRGNNVDSGAIQVINNQMHMLLGSGKQAIDLTDNGTSLIMEDGAKYTNYIINTLTEVEPEIGTITAEYINGINSIKLNLDNTIVVSDGETTRYGAYTIKSIEKNIAGNIEILNEISATFNNEDGSQNIVVYNITSFSGILTDETGISYKANYQTAGYEFRSPDNLDGKSETYFTNAHKVTFKLLKPLEFKKGTRSYFKCFVNGTAYSFGSFVNGVNVASNGSAATSYEVGTYDGDFNYQEYVTLYFYGTNTSYFNNDNAKFVIATNSAAANLGSSSAVEMIPIYYEKLGTVTADLTMRSVVYEQTPFVKTCDVISDYYTGTFTNDTLSVELTDDSAVVTPTGAEAITATSYTVSAVTDGTNITHTVTIVYSDAEGTEHTLTYNIVNNATISQNGLLDGSEIELNKN